MENKHLGLTCSLSSAQLRERKQTVIGSLKEILISKKELPNGYAYQFKGTDDVLDELLLFIKTERLCCSFFYFNLSLNRQGLVWLELSGPDGAKEFIDKDVQL